LWDNLLDNSDKELHNVLLKLIDDIKGTNNTFRRDTSSSASDGDPIDKIKRLSKVYDDTIKVNKRVTRTMAEGIPIIGSLVKAMKKGTKELDISLRGTSDAYKSAAKATNEYTYRVGQNSEDLATVQKTLRDVQKKSQQLAELTEKRTNIEKRITDNVKDTRLKDLKISSDLSNVGKLIKEAEKELSLDKKSPNAPQLTQTITDLRELGEIPKLFTDLKGELGKKDVQEAMRRDQALAQIMQPIMDGLGDNIQDAADNIKEYSETVKDAFAGSVAAHENVIKKNTKNLEDATDGFGKALTALGASLALAVGTGAKKEASLLLTRQQTTGAVGRYSMRGEALAMGVSETDLLTSVAENRYAMRRLGQAEGFDGASDFVESPAFQEMRKTSYEMGFVGKAALDNMMRFSQSLRAVGADSSADSVSGAMKFVKDTHINLGISQDEMVSFFSDMMSGGSLRLGATGPGVGSFAQMKAIEDEITFRGKLATVLNQDLQLQKKRVQEQRQLRYGNVIDAFKRSIGATMLGTQLGMDPTETKLVAEYMRAGGANMSDEDRNAAIVGRENMAIRAGTRLDELSKMDPDVALGERAVLERFMELHGVTVDEAIQATERSGGQLITSVDQVDSTKLGKTNDPNVEMGIMRKLLSGVEHIVGIRESSVGAGATAIIVAMGGFTQQIVAAIIAQGIMGGKAGKAGKFAKAAAAGTLAFGKRAAAATLRRSPHILAITAGYKMGETLGSRPERERLGAIQQDTLDGLNRIIEKMQTQGKDNLGNRSLDDIIAERDELAGSMVGNSFTDKLLMVDPQSGQTNIERNYAGKINSAIPFNSNTIQTVRQNGNVSSGPLSLTEAMRLSRTLTSSPLDAGGGTSLSKSTGEEYRRQAEMAIISFVNSEDFSKISTDVGALKELDDYLLEDGKMMEGEMEVLTAIQNAIIELTDVNKKELDVANDANKNANMRWNDLTYAEQQQEVNSALNNAVAAANATVTRRMAAINDMV